MLTENEIEVIQQSKDFHEAVVGMMDFSNLVKDIDAINSDQEHSKKFRCELVIHRSDFFNPQLYGFRHTKIEKAILKIESLLCKVKGELNLKNELVVYEIVFYQPDRLHNLLCKAELCKVIHNN